MQGLRPSTARGCKRDALPTELSAPARDLAANKAFSPVVNRAFAERSGNERNGSEPRVPNYPRRNELPPLTMEGIALLSVSRDLISREQPRRPRPKAATIYFVGAQNGPIKIGFSEQLKLRLNDLRLASPVPLALLATLEGPPSLERAYHQLFATSRLHGEWFSPHPEILAEIDRINGLIPSPNALTIAGEVL